MFRDRTEAGRLLGEKLAERDLFDPVVLGLPRGGIPVGAEIARVLNAPLDVLVVRKLGCPWQPELGVGAIAEQGVRVLNRELMARLDLSDEDLEPVAATEEAELRRRLSTYRGTRPPEAVEGRQAIVVDDGLATGFTARAGIEIVRERGASSVLLAIPVGPADAVRALEYVADGVVVLATPEPFLAIGQWYLDFDQVPDAHVAALLQQALQRTKGA